MGLCGSKDASTATAAGTASASASASAPAPARVVRTEQPRAPAMTTAKPAQTATSTQFARETRRLGSKDDGNDDTVPAAPAAGSARVLAARAAEQRLQQQQQTLEHGQLGARLAEERRKTLRTHALEEYARTQPDAV